MYASTAERSPAAGPGSHGGVIAVRCSTRAAVGLTGNVRTLRARARPRAPPRQRRPSTWQQVDRRRPSGSPARVTGITSGIGNRPRPAVLSHDEQRPRQEAADPAAGAAEPRARAPVLRHPYAVLAGRRPRPATEPARGQARADPVARAAAAARRRAGRLRVAAAHLRSG